MIATRTASVSSASYTDITPSFDCKKVTITEDDSVAGAPTVDLIAKGQVTGSVDVRKGVGKGFQFTTDGYFSKSSVLVSIKTASGSSTIQIVEES